jgi:hypothetical protein
VFTFTPWLLYPGEKALCTPSVGSWVGHSASLDILEKKQISRLSVEYNSSSSNPNHNGWSDKNIAAPTLVYIIFFCNFLFLANSHNKFINPQPKYMWYNKISREIFIFFWHDDFTEK